MREIGQLLVAAGKGFFHGSRIAVDSRGLQGRFQRTAIDPPCDVTIGHQATDHAFVGLHEGDKGARYPHYFSAQEAGGGRILHAVCRQAVVDNDRRIRCEDLDLCNVQAGESHAVDFHALDYPGGTCLASHIVQVEAMISDLDRLARLLLRLR